MNETTTVTVAGFVERVVRAAVAMPKGKPCPTCGGRASPACNGCPNDETGTIPNEQRAGLLATFLRECIGPYAEVDDDGRPRLIAWYCAFSDYGVSQRTIGSNVRDTRRSRLCPCDGTGYVPRDFSALDGPGLVQAHIGLARDVASVLGWTAPYLDPNDGLWVIWDVDGQRDGVRLTMDNDVAEDAAAFGAVLRALEGVK